jgi:hypothetical protein
MYYKIPIKLTNLSTGEETIYDRLSFASKAISGNKGNIGYCLRNNKDYKGYRLEYYKET